jgi:hypothetical protein
LKLLQDTFTAEDYSGVDLGTKINELLRWLYLLGIIKIASISDKSERCCRNSWTHPMVKQTKFLNKNKKSKTTAKACKEYMAARFQEMS